MHHQLTETIHLNLGSLHYKQRTQHNRQIGQAFVQHCTSEPQLSPQYEAPALTYIHVHQPAVVGRDRQLHSSTTAGQKPQQITGNRNVADCAVVPANTLFLDG